MSSINFTAKHKVDMTKLFSISANIENMKTLIMHPASIRCQQMSAAKKVVKGINKDFIRLSGRSEDRKILKVFTELQA